MDARMMTNIVVSAFKWFLLPLIPLYMVRLKIVEGAEALYAFGDSFVDTGNSDVGVPYGSTWPGYPAGRASDGRNQVDYFAELFGLPSPTPFKKLKNNESIRGVNFGKGGAGVTYAWGYTPLDTQVNELEALVVKGMLSKSHLKKSIALVSLGVNDYGAYNTIGTPKELHTIVTTVVDGIALNIVRLHWLGLQNIIVSNLALMACSPYVTVATKYGSCSTNTTFFNETLQHNALLEARIDLLKYEFPTANIVIVDQTKAFEYLFHHGTKAGFVDMLTPCCKGKHDSYMLNCGIDDNEGRPLYKLCTDVSQAVIFDGIHPTQAAWKVIVNLYTNVTGFTIGGPKLHTWIKEYNL